MNFPEIRAILTSVSMSRYLFYEFQLVGSLPGEKLTIIFIFFFLVILIFPWPLPRQRR